MSKENRKVLVLGYDGMDPHTAKRVMDNGRMPNLKKFIERGAARNDLRMLGALPAITPAQWTTLAVGCYPNVHGVTDFWNQAPDALDAIIYGLDSRLCKAEQMWNVTAAAGKKTLVWQWPGSSWPPSSNSENLYVVDGTQPASVNYSIANVDFEKYTVASKDFSGNEFESATKSKNMGDASTDCVIDNLDLDSDKKDDTGKYEKEFELTAENRQEFQLNRYKMKRIKNMSFHDTKGNPMGLSKVPYDHIESAITEPSKWGFDIPEGALEFSPFTSDGQLRRPCLILKNEAGLYDTVAVYQSKKNETPLCILKEGVIVEEVFDVCIVEGEQVNTSRSYEALEIAPDGSKVRLWMSTAFKDSDERWSPTSLYKEVTDNCGPCRPFSQMGGTSLEFAQKILTPLWRLNAFWQARCINYMIREKGVEVVFSHHHFVDHSAHQFWNYACQKEGREPEELWQEQIDRTYEVADEYLGQFMHLLDEGWAILLVSDHGIQIHSKPLARLGFGGGISAGIMRELGWTVMKKDANGNDTREVDWTKTRAVAIRTSYIWINLKGRDRHVMPDGSIIDGLVDPSEKYDLEDAIIDSLYNYRDENGERVVAYALRNKEAEIVGLDGPLTGDIIYANKEYMVNEHGNGISTYYGYYGTSLSPIFAAAGDGIRHDDDVKRVIRQVDVAPTVAALLGLRVPAQCEGAPVYQILEQD